jgi:hypothetical protein
LRCIGTDVVNPTHIVLLSESCSSPARGSLRALWNVTNLNGGDP